MSRASERTVRYESADGVATVTIDRPDAMNALDVPTKVQLRDSLAAAAADDGVRCVLLTGTGRAFCVGQDLREHVGLLQSKDESLWTTVTDHYNPIATTLATMPKPVVAAINGVAAGAGASLAMAADLRVLGESGAFNMAFTGIALSADSGATYWLPRLVGMPKARELLLMPRTVKAEECLRLGLATEVVPDDELAARAGELARTLASGPTLAYASVRKALTYSATHDLADSLAHEAKLMSLTGGTADHAEAVEAFLAKRPPVFTGH